MDIRNGSRVRVRDGATHWYGTVTGKAGNDIQVRIGGSDRVVAVSPDRIRPPYETGREVLTESAKAHSLLLLGCQYHGLSGQASLLAHHKESGQRFAVIFLEEYPYHARDGVDLGKLEAQVKSKAKEGYEHLLKQKISVLEKLRSTCDLVVGLETDAAMGGANATSKEQDRFGEEARCTVANREWASVISRHLPSSGTSVVCCGAAHLVPIQEKVMAETLQASLPRVGVALRTPAFAVAATENGLHRPKGTPSGILRAFPDIEDGDDEVVYESDSDSSSGSSSEAD